MTDADNLIRQLDEKDAEIGRLESLLDRARPLARKNLEQAAEIEELKAEIAALREIVEACEWHQQSNNHALSCPSCGNYEGDGHKPDCPILKVQRRKP